MFLEDTWKYLKGYIKIRIEGYFIERFLNLCMVRGIEVWNIKRLNDVELKANIKHKDYKEVEEISKITRCKLIKEFEKGVPDLTLRYKKRKIFACIFLTISIFIYLYSARIWQIEIVGDFKIPIEELWNELETEGVKIGIKKSKLDYDKIKSNIYVRRNDIAWMGFDIKGTKAYVEFVERNNIKEDELKNEPCNIISDKDGVIHKILVKSGKKLVNVGDVVSKGQILISGYISSGEFGSRTVHSDGEVLLKTFYTNKATVPLEKDLVNKTGNKERKYKLEIGNIKINFINNGTKFEKYDTITVSNKLKLFNKFELPIKLTELRYEELKIDTVKYTKLQAENIAKAESINGLKKLVNNLDEIVINNNFNIKENEDSISAEITVEVIEKVGIKERIDN